MKTYSGKYKVKNTEKYVGDVNDVVYRSLWELWAFKWCDDNPNIKHWGSEITVVPYYYEVDKKYHRYFVDLTITTTKGKTILVEIKPDAQTRPPTSKRKTKRYITEGFTYVKNRNKWDTAGKYATERGWTFEIWTENTLTQMGIMPKSRGKVPGKLKPLKAFKKPKKKV